MCLGMLANPLRLIHTAFLSLVGEWHEREKCYPRQGRKAYLAKVGPETETPKTNSCVDCLQINKSRVHESCIEARGNQKQMRRERPSCLFTCI